MLKRKNIVVFFWFIFNYVCLCMCMSIVFIEIYIEILLNMRMWVGNRVWVFGESSVKVFDFWVVVLVLFGEFWKEIIEYRDIRML